jgi:hypothetical protein
MLKRKMVGYDERFTYRDSRRKQQSGYEVGEEVIVGNTCDRL